MPHRFTKTMIHTSDQLGVPSPYMGERRQTAKVSSGTSNFPMGNAQKYCVADLSECKVKPIGGDGIIDAQIDEGQIPGWFTSLEAEISQMWEESKLPRLR